MPLPLRGGGITYSFVDDSDERYSLKKMANVICENISNKEAELLLSSPKYYDKLLHKCMQIGVDRCYDGIKFMANKISEHFRKKYDCGKIIAIQMSGFGSTQKHLGDIVEILKKNGLRVVYIVSSEHFWLNEIVETFEKSGELYVLADCEFLENLNFFPFVIEQTNIIRFHTGVHSLKIVTSMEQISNPVCSKKGMLDILNYGFLGASYLNIHSRSLFEILQKKQAFDGFLPDNSAMRFVRGGYPSIEKEIKEFGDIDYSVKRDTVIFISCFLNFEMPDKLFNVMSKLLEFGYRVLFKSCPPLEETKKDEECDFANKFLKYDNFVYWDNSSPRLSRDELQRSICAIEIYSSMMYSYPVITKRPAILLYPSQDSFKENEDSFYNENLHIRIFDDQVSSLWMIIEKLSNNLEYQKEWERKIIHYCADDLYNYGHASQYLADWILDWYKRRSLLQNRYF